MQAAPSQKLIRPEGLSPTDPKRNVQRLQEALSRAGRVGGTVLVPAGIWPLAPLVKRKPLQQGLFWPPVRHALSVPGGVTLRGEDGAVLSMPTGMPPPSTAFLMIVVEEGARAVRFENLTLDGGIRVADREGDCHGVALSAGRDILFSKVAFRGWRGKGAFLAGHPTDRAHQLEGVTFQDCTNRDSLGQFFTAVGTTRLRVTRCRATDNQNYLAGGGAEAIILRACRDVTIDSFFVRRWGSAVSLTKGGAGIEDVRILDGDFADQECSASQTRVSRLTVRNCRWDFSQLSSQRSAHMNFAADELSFADCQIIGGGDKCYLSFGGRGAVENCRFDFSRAARPGIFVGHTGSGMAIRRCKVTGHLDLRAGCTAAENNEVIGRLILRGCTGRFGPLTISGPGEPSVKIEKCQNLTLTGLSITYPGKAWAIAVLGGRDIRLEGAQIRLTGASKVAMRNDGGQEIRLVGAQIQASAALPITLGKVASEGGTRTKKP